MPHANIFRPIWIGRETILDRRIGAYYLSILDRVAEHLGDRIQVEPDERFFRVLEEQVQK